MSITDDTDNTSGTVTLDCSIVNIKIKKNSQFPKHLQDLKAPPLLWVRSAARSASIDHSDIMEKNANR